MTPDQIVQFFTGNFVVLATKLFLLVLIFLYAIFAAVVVRQVQLMNKVITEVGFSPVLFTIAVLHLAAVVILFLFVILLI